MTPSQHAREKEPIMSIKRQWVELAIRCETAQYADSSIRRDLALMVGWKRFAPSQLGRKSSGWISPDDYIGVNSDGSPVLDSLHGTSIHYDVPPFDTSLDASLALVNKWLPDAVWELTLNAATIWEGDGLCIKGSNEKSPVYSLLAAFCRTMALRDDE